MTPTLRFPLLYLTADRSDGDLLGVLTILHYRTCNSQRYAADYTFRLSRCISCMKGLDIYISVSEFFRDILIAARLPIFNIQPSELLQTPEAYQESRIVKLSSKWAEFVAYSTLASILLLMQCPTIVRQVRRQRKGLTQISTDTFLKV